MRGREGPYRLVALPVGQWHRRLQLSDPHTLSVWLWMLTHAAAQDDGRTYTATVGRARYHIHVPRGCVCAPDRRVEKETGVHRSSVQRALRRLEEGAFIQRVLRLAIDPDPEPQRRAAMPAVYRVASYDRYVAFISEGEPQGRAATEPQRRAANGTSKTQPPQGFSETSDEGASRKGEPPGSKRYHEAGGVGLTKPYDSSSVREGEDAALGPGGATPVSPQDVDPELQLRSADECLDLLGDLRRRHPEGAAFAERMLWLDLNRKVDVGALRAFVVEMDKLLADGVVRVDRKTVGCMESYVRSDPAWTPSSVIRTIYPGRPA